MWVWCIDRASPLSHCTCNRRYPTGVRASGRERAGIGCWCVSCLPAIKERLSLLRIGGLERRTREEKLVLCSSILALLHCERCPSVAARARDPLASRRCKREHMGTCYPGAEKTSRFNASLRIAGCSLLCRPSSADCYSLTEGVWASLLRNRARHCWPAD